MNDSWECKCKALNSLSDTKCWKCSAPPSAVQFRQNLERSEQQLEEQARFQEQNARLQQENEARAAALRERRINGRSSMRDLLLPYLSRAVGANIRQPSKTERATLMDVQEDFFTLAADGLAYHVPYAAVLRVVTSMESSDVSTGLIYKDKYAAVITLLDLVIYKGAIGVGMSIPIGGDPT